MSKEFSVGNEEREDNFSWRQSLQRRKVARSCLEEGNKVSVGASGV